MTGLADYYRARVAAANRAAARYAAEHGDDRSAERSHLLGALEVIVEQLIAELEDRP